MKPLLPNQFKVNEAWIVVKVNEIPIELREGNFYIYVIMDAASTYIIGQALSKVENDSPSKDDVTSIFKSGWDQTKSWPKKLIIPDAASPNNSFFTTAQQLNIAVEFIPKTCLLSFIKPVQESFLTKFGRV